MVNKTETESQTISYRNGSCKPPGKDIRNETIRTEVGMKETEEQQLRRHGPRHANARRVAERYPQGNKRLGGQASTRKYGIRDSVQTRNLKDENCIYREIPLITI
jgi:hypothetical protein